MIKKFFTNAFLSPFTTLMGTIAGLPEIIEGVQTANHYKLIQGIAMLLLGVFSNENLQSK